MYRRILCFKIRRPYIGKIAPPTFDTSFDESWYLAENPDIELQGYNAKEHYETRGKHEGRAANKEALNTPAYAMCYPKKETFYTDELIKGSNCTITHAPTILLISHEMSTTGAPAALKNTGIIFKELGFNIEVWTFPHITDKHIFDELQCRVCSVPAFPKDTSSLRKRLRNFALIFCNTVVSSEYVKICKKHKIKHIWMIHEAQNMEIFIRVHLIKRELFHSTNNNVLCVSEYARQCIHKLTGAHCTPLLNYIEDIGEESIQQKAQVEFVIVGVQPRKGLGICLKAFQQLPAQYKGRCKLHIVGSASNDLQLYQHSLQQLYSHNQHIIWHGRIVGPQKYKVFKQADCFLIPSTDDAAPLVALEAAMLGRPCIISENVGQQCLTENQAGFICKTGNIEDLKRHMIWIIEHPDKLAAMGKAARRNFLRYGQKEQYKHNLAKILSELRITNTPNTFPAVSLSNNNGGSN